MQTTTSPGTAAGSAGLDVGTTEGSAPATTAAVPDRAGAPPKTTDAAWTGVPASGGAFPSFDAGIQALLDAEQLSRSAAGHLAALLLVRSALRQLIRATLVGRARLEPGASESDLWQAARVVPLWQEGSRASEWLTGPETWFERYVVSSAGDLELAEVPEAERAELLRRMLELGFALARPLDGVRNGAARQRRRRLRAALLLVGVLAVALGFGLRAALRAPNLARGKAVMLLNPDRNIPINPAALVDGDQLALGFHSKPGADQKVTIDLGRVHVISRIEIFNRPDCCQERGVPLSVQISTDGRNFVNVRQETHTYYHLSVRLQAPRQARYVRLVRGGTDVFHLSEVEVY